VVKIQLKLANNQFFRTKIALIIWKVGKSKVKGQKSKGKIQRAKVKGQKSKGKSQRAKVKGQKSKGKSQRAKVKGQNSKGKIQKSKVIKGIALQRAVKVL
jgi:1,2-phenylacetyl-CoA epoxidase PaaB subunit